MNRTAALHNLGCKVNAYETEAMQQMLEEAGYTIVPFEEKADVYIINTCTVTNVADKKSRQMLHRAKSLNSDSVVVAAGCYVTAAEEVLKQDDAVDLIIGNNRKKDLVSLLEGFFEGEEQDAVPDLMHEKEYENLSLSKTGEHTRAYVKVQDGCNQFCSYCIIPFARGRVRSRKMDDVLSEITELAKNGYREVVLTGIHLSSYGVDLEDETLLSLILAVHEIEGIDRIRLGSLEPGIITEEFARTTAALPKMCPHFHLSLQSGCTKTLKAMNRRYTAEEFRERCATLRKYYDRPALTTDVIVGFPGEMEEDFLASEEFLKEIRFFETHIFKYSRRKGTKADQMPDQVPEKIKGVRSAILLALNEKNMKEYQEQFLGEDTEVLFEEAVTIDGETYQIGHNMRYMEVLLKTEEDLRNQIISVKLSQLLPDGKVLAER